MRFGGVNSDVVSSSVWRVSQSMTKSGNAAIRLFLSLMTELISDICVLESTSIEISPHPLDDHPIASRGHIEVDLAPRLLMPVYIVVSLLLSGLLR